MYFVDNFVFDKNHYQLIAYGKDKKVPVPYYSIANHYVRPYWNRHITKCFAHPDYYRTCQFLNWLEQHGIDVESQISDIDPEIMEQYLLEYCDSGVGEVSRIEMHKTLCRLYALSHAKNYGERKELYEEIYKDLDFYHLPSGEPDVKVYRDCPQFFVDLMLQKAKDKDICLYTILMLQICTGMRPSEVLNMRTKNSSYGAGYFEEYDDIGAIKSLTIDISKKAIFQPLRSDGKKRDSNKKARKVQVFGKHRVKAAWSAIQEYLTYTQGWLREPTEPLFVNKTTKELHRKDAKGSYRIIKVHMARTYRSYANDYKRLILDDVIPALSRGDMEQVGYASILATHAFGPHMLREYFTCRLYEEGYDWLTIMAARGDKSPQTAIIYLLKGGTVKKISIQNADKIGEEIVEEQGMTRKEYLEKYATDQTIKS